MKAIANALNEGDLARAQIATVLLGIPDPPLPEDGRSSGKMIQFIRDLHGSGLIKWDDGSLSSLSPSATGPASPAPRGIEAVLEKAGYNPDEPRDERGRWTDGGGGTAASTSSPCAQVKPVDSEHEDFWETLASRLSDAARSALSQIGHTELAENDAEIAASTAVASTIVSDLSAYANYRAQPWIGPDGVPVQVPVIDNGDPLSDQAGLMGHDLLAPDAPLTRPGTNADWIDALVDLSSAGATLAGPALEAAGAGAAVAADTVDLAADAPFIILPSELPAGFDYTWPVGRYVIPTGVPPGTIYGNLAHEQIGDLVQGGFPDVNMILKTAPSNTDVDIEIPIENVPSVGFRYAEIKPVSESGYRRYRGQVARWNKPEPVLAITYDYQGNIYYGFPW